MVRCLDIATHGAGGQTFSSRIKTETVEGRNLRESVRSDIELAA